MSTEDRGMSPYQALILEHSKSPRGWGALAPGTALVGERTGVNPLCGDQVTLRLGHLTAGGATVGFESQGCALCRASASILAEAATGLAPAALRRLVNTFRTEFPSRAPPAAWLPAAVLALYDLRHYPARQHCVMLAWETLAALTELTVPDQAAAEPAGSPPSTEQAKKEPETSG